MSEELFGRDPNAEDDALYAEAVAIVVRDGSASITNLQRKMRIGFSRAAGLLDMMEVRGIVTASGTGKPREVVKR